MKIEEFKEQFNTIIADPDKGTALAGDFISAVESDYTARDEAVEKITELETRVRDLQDTNMKLYLAQTGGAVEEDEPEDELEGFDAVEQFVDNLLKEEESED